MPAGYLALVLHGHLPYVYHPEQSEALEERWLFEALTECYLPLIDVFQALARDSINYRITLSLSPTLITMLTNELLQQRYMEHLNKLLALAGLEEKRLGGDANYGHLPNFYMQKITRARNLYLECGHNPLLPLKQLQRQGYLEIITTCATHGFLPLIRSREGWRGQVKPALDLYTRHFGHPPAGIWLPECGFAPGVDEILAEYGIKYFFVDQHGITNSRPAPYYGIYAPVCTRPGVAVFGRDPESSRQVWDRHAGYPGDPLYREFYRDIGYDLNLDYVGHYLPDGHIRIDTGFKYHRISGPDRQKEPYLPEHALERAVRDAKDFHHRRLEQAQKAGRSMDRIPMITAPYDAELFGHWWYEGPAWLEFLCRETAAGNSLRMVTPGGYLHEYPQSQTVEIPMSSWGAGGYNQYWLNPSTDWIYWHLHRAEDRMSELADLHQVTENPDKRCLNQAARELLLAQSSDWPFIMHSGTTVDYAVKRFKNHIGRFNMLAEMLEKNEVDVETLTEIETRSPFLPDINYQVFRSDTAAAKPKQQPVYRVLILSWEYPPKTVGGLARHVHDLSVALAEAGSQVHVITCPVAKQGVYTLDKGVHVHRIHPNRLTADNFMDWVEQLNNGMLDLSIKMMEVYDKFDLIHAHDWLVGTAAVTISHRCKLPLVATIHATEHGRNRGLHTDLQRHIHQLEGELARQADLVIGCSRYMGHEIATLFDQPADKIRVIPNGVDPDNITTGLGTDSVERQKRKVIVFLGRLVSEKGVHVLISALPAIMEAVGPVKLQVAGKGPYQQELEKLAHSIGVSEQVEFLGFVDDPGRNKLLHQATVAVFPSIYEPFGIVALEAMAAGVPVVVSDTGGLSDVIEHGVDGYLSPPGDIHMLAHYVSEVISNTELARHFVHRARRNIMVKFSWKQIAAATREVYSEAIKKGSLFSE
ncbi:MAG TPA: DUF1957 domain-containing protein [Desulfotomaculum sp.]|nr:MAG: glycosyl transferase family 1 [Desulfotomaculum sp. BICA1-6]HBX24036.1 DUF1957 domain-containing protein [Desulfotomaculum sp.]